MRMPIAAAKAAAEGEAAASGQLARRLGVVQLTAISIGATLGTGILVVLGTAVPVAGPGVWISFIIAGLAALVSALAYAEMAGRVPIAGSSYSYAYATLGEGIAWVCGWCLILEYAVSVAAVAVGAGEYVNEMLRVFGLSLPDALAGPPGAGGVVNLPAAAVIIFATILLVRGVSESATVNTIMVIVKIAILVFFIAVAITAFNGDNFSPLAPMGAAGITGAASRLFFSYIGFDAASTAGEEAKNAQRDLPRAIIASMIIVTALYILVAVTAIGAWPWQRFGEKDASLSQILTEVTGQTWFGVVFAVGAIIAITSVVLTVLYGQTRILVTMARDGLVPRIFGRVSATHRTPVWGTIITGTAVAIVAALVPLGALADATSIGTLCAFAIVNVAVILLRRREGKPIDSYRTPLYPVTPIIGFLLCVCLMVSLDGVTWIVFGCWMLAGAAVYFGYSRRHSVLGKLGATIPRG